MASIPDVLIDTLACEAAGRVTLDLPRLEIHAGERVAIVGHNGAGKSTLLRCLTGFALPARGQVRVLGHALECGLRSRDLRALRRDVGQVMQGSHLVPRLSALDNVMIGNLGRSQGLAAWRSWMRWHSAAGVAQAQQALVAVGLADRFDTRSDRLSGGERQKVAIARLLLQRPRLILADEPTASLDPQATHEVCALLADAARGRTLVTVVHDTRVLPLLADRVIGLRHGRLAFDLPLTAVNETTLAALYAGNATPDRVRRTCPRRAVPMAA